MTEDLLTSADDRPAAVTSAAIKAGLRTSMANGHQVFFEVGNDTGTKVTRHADAVAIGIWPSTGYQIHGFEIKVSRGDFLNEMKQPEKSWPVMQYCHRWALVTPPGLVKVDELPPNWGLRTFDGKVMRTVKQSPLLTPIALSPGFVAALVRRAGDEDGALIAEVERRARASAKKDFDERLERELSRRQSHNAEEAKKAIAFFRAFKEALGEQWLGTDEAPRLIEALRTLRRHGIASTYSALFRMIGDMERSAAALRKTLADVGFEAKQEDDE